MIDRFLPKTLGRLLRTSLLAGVILTGMAMSSQLAAQSSDDAPNAPPQDEDMGVPPDFIPPPPPDDLIIPPRSTVSRPTVRPSGNTQQSPGQRITSEQLLNRPSDLVDDEDPLMQETVGLIRIPEMGTNEVLEMLENFTGKPILRQQTLP